MPLHNSRSTDRGHIIITTCNEGKIHTYNVTVMQCLFEICLRDNTLKGIAGLNLNIFVAVSVGSYVYRRCLTVCKFVSFLPFSRNPPNIRLTFRSLAVTLRTTRYNIKKFCTLITLDLCVLCGSRNKQQLLPYT